MPYTPYKNHHLSSTLCNFNTGITLPPKYFERPHTPLIFTNSRLLHPSPGLAPKSAWPASPSTSLKDLSPWPTCHVVPKPSACAISQVLLLCLTIVSVQLRRKLVIVGDGMHVTVLPWTPSEEQNPQVLVARHHYFAPLLSENFPRNM